MNGANQNYWGWIWPSVGPTPVNQGLDSEMFDRVDYPYTETFVREAIQNSMDARLDHAMPVIVRFSFYKAKLSAQKSFLKNVFTFRNKAGLQELEEWNKELISWLVVEDFNSKGLDGDLSDRTSDFWNYWLNFGLSNKDGSGRGGRGIGRVTFLIASKIHTVIGYTRRHNDCLTAACGMCLLRARKDGQVFRSTHAYLAEKEYGSVFQLHSSEIHADLKNAFKLNGYDSMSGLGLIIPYPHEELIPKGILAASIEHFAPAIMSGSLVVEVDDVRLDQDSIVSVALDVSDQINAEAIRKDVSRYLGLISIGLESAPVRLAATKNNKKISLDKEKVSVVSKKLSEQMESDNTVILEVSLPLEKDSIESTVRLTAVLGHTPPGFLPIDRMFREGMSLPDVKAKSPGEMDLVILVEDQKLGTYLNFCEGKAHLDLLESKDVKEKLISKGYTGSTVSVKRFIKGLPTELRLLLAPEITDPDGTVFDTFFSIPIESPGARSGKDQGNEPTKPPTPDPPEPRIAAFKVLTLDDGFCVKANPEFMDWPVNLSVSMAYADGSRKPAWSEFDFRLEELPIEYSGCIISTEKNKIKALNCEPDSWIQITGFDTNRELDTTIRTWKDAQTD